MTEQQRDHAGYDNRPSGVPVRRRRWVRGGRLACVAGLTVAAGMAGAATVSANIAAPVRAPARIGPELSSNTPLVVREERLAFQCDEVDGRPVCSFEARYQVENPTAQVVSGRAAFYGLNSEGIVVRVDGRPAGVDLSDDDVRALDAEVDDASARGGRGEPLDGNDSSLLRHGFELSVPPHGRAEILVTGRTEPGRTTYSRGYDYTPAAGRHLLLHSGDPSARIFEVEYLVSPIKSWASVGRMVVSIRYPKSWTVNPSFWHSEERARAAWETREEGDWVVSSVTANGALDMDSVDNTLTFFISLKGAAIEHGGPYVGIGGVLGSSQARGFRTRFGYEVAAPSWLVESLTLDADFDGRVVVSPNLEAAMPHFLMIPILPSIGVGAGVPVQIAPKATVGARLMGTAQLWPVGFVASVDMFPGLSSEQGSFQVSLLGRLSL